MIFFFSGPSNQMTMRVMFTVAGPSDPFSYDSDAPECDVTYDTYEEQCGAFRGEDNCQQAKWTARFSIRVR